MHVKTYSQVKEVMMEEESEASSREYEPLVGNMTSWLC